MDLKSFASAQQYFSRRNFMRSAGIASAAVAAMPAFGLQQGTGVQSPAGPSHRVGGGAGDDMGGGRRPMAPDTVIISSNENPLGPAPCALEAIGTAAKKGGRYDREYSTAMTKAISDQHGLKAGYVRIYPGSGGPLDLALYSNIGPDKPLVLGDPTYEQGFRAAITMKAKYFMVPLDKTTYKYDVKAMLAAHPNPGAYYIVNPNNPTGTITPKEDIAWLVANKPAGSIVIVDEAYHHFSDQDSVIDMVAADKDVIVLRTFSKIYGMAGVRAGFAFGRPDLLARFETVTPNDRQIGSISLTSAAAAAASLNDKQLVPLRRKINKDTLDDTLAFLSKGGYKFVPNPQANMFMVDVKRPGAEVQHAMIGEKVAIGRVWPIMPTYVRVTVGLPEEMKKFQVAFHKVMNEPTKPMAAHLDRFDIPHELNRG
ncbi:MAG: aminotransferase class I/II-fold pyridoxal phosphate-dependent enzyme [Janthinobacterium lividum]